MNPARVDAIIDLAYGALILLAIALIATLDIRIGLTFGLGVFSSYVLHVVWKMARFDADWMTRTVEETVDETVGQQVEETVEQTVGEQLDEVQAQVETVDERIDRRPRKDQIEEIIEDSVQSERVGDGDDSSGGA